jgi:predicted negative regulator of RcsB-dependent stress response
VNNKSSQTQPTSKAAKQAAPAAMDMEALKRDMRNAQLLDWLRRNSAALIVGAIFVVFVIAGTAVWIEKHKSERNAAATMYFQALAVVKDSDKKQLLNALVARHFGTAYTALAEMQLARLDDAHAAKHLQAVIDNAKSMPEWVWQARLDLARIRIAQGKEAEAAALLQHSVGPAYEQLRQYLLAKASSGTAEKITHLKQAQAAQSLDQNLARRIDSELQALEAQKSSAPAG